MANTFAYSQNSMLVSVWQNQTIAKGKSNSYQVQQNNTLLFVRNTNNQIDKRFVGKQIESLPFSYKMLKKTQNQLEEKIKNYLGTKRLESLSQETMLVSIYFDSDGNAIEAKFTLNTKTKLSPIIIEELESNVIRKFRMSLEKGTMSDYFPIDFVIKFYQLQ